jgi:cell division protein FtsB
MSKIEVLTAVFLGTVVYVLISFFGGQDGLWAEQQLEAQKREISLRTAHIASINSELMLEYQALKNDPEVIASYARKLGYVSDGEKLVKINGLPQRSQTVYSTGTVLKRGTVRFIPEWICKLTGMGVFALVMLVFLLRGLKNALSERGQSAAAAQQTMEVEENPADRYEDGDDFQTHIPYL